MAYARRIYIRSKNDFAVAAIFIILIIFRVKWIASKDKMENVYETYNADSYWARLIFVT